MAACTVLFRFHGGFVFRGATQQEQEACMKGFKEMVRKWKSAGVKLKATVSCSSNPGGFSHHLILEVDSLERAQQLNDDVFGGPVGKYIESYAFDVGTPTLEKDWVSA